MIALLDVKQLGGHEEEIGCPVGQLITPLTGYLNHAVLKGRPWAMDNGAFSGFLGDKFLAKLEREKPHRDACLWVALPDVVGSARRTLECFKVWSERVRGWPIALVAQDGIEDLPIPWHQIDAVFIGGSTRFKVSDAAADVVRAAKIIGKWAHIGRLNTPERFERWLEIGADSFDGTGICRYTHMRSAIKRAVSGVEPKFDWDAAATE